MKKLHEWNRRDMLGTMLTGAVGAAMGGTLRADDATPATAAGSASTKEIPGDPRVRGPFPILSTPFTEKGELDYDVLAKQAQFVDKCGCSGMIWPQSGDSVDYLTMDEKLKGMEVLADAMKGRKSALCLGVQGKDTAEMLVYAKHVEKLGVPAIISRPPDEGKTEDDLREYWNALAKTVTRPVIIQTSGGTKYKGPGPSVKLLIELGTQYKHFGYVKEETGPILQRMQQLYAARPHIKCIFSAMGGFGWLHQFRYGSEGLVTERAVYADLLEDIWQRHLAGDDVGAADLFSKVLLMLNLKETIPCNQLRGFHLYVWIKRGVFKNMISRSCNPQDANGKPFFSEMKLTNEQIAEIDLRFEAIKPYLHKLD
ncbi:MAG: dihydrodipicolinate synthase family protein [Planctomycetia bacterium]|nr:dihydrodipicolinate synthase family protein [Planctomycetia bacterium]